MDGEGIALSFLLPHYKRAREWFSAYAHNHDIFNQPATEVVLALDDPSDRVEIMEEIKFWRANTKFRVMEYCYPHPWRGPARALNVALRNSSGHYVCVLSPETHIKLPYPEFLLENWCEESELVTHWLSGFMHYGRQIGEPWRSNWPEGFGMLMTARKNLERIGGWDENWKGAGEDDDIRNRLERSYVHRVLSPQIKLSHYAAYDSVEQGGHVPRTKDHYRGGDNEPVVKNPDGWGQEPGWIKIWDWK